MESTSLYSEGAQVGKRCHFIRAGSGSSNWKEMTQRRHSQPCVVIKGNGTGRGKGRLAFLSPCIYINRYQNSGVGREADSRAEIVNEPVGGYGGHSAPTGCTSSDSANCRSKTFGGKNSRTFQESKL